MHACIYKYVCTLCMYYVRTFFDMSPIKCTSTDLALRVGRNAWRVATRNYVVLALYMPDVEQRHDITLQTSNFT